MNIRNASRWLSVIALAVVMAAGAQAAPPTPDATNTRVNLSGLSTNGHYDRFIVTYTAGSRERSDRSAMVQNIDAAIDRAGLNRGGKSIQGAPRVPVRASFRRALSVGGDLVRTTRKLDRVEAEALMNQIAADPAVEHVAPDVMMQRTPDIRAQAALAPRRSRRATPIFPTTSGISWRRTVR